MFVLQFLAGILILSITSQECWGASIDYDVEANKFLSDASTTAFDLFNKIAHEAFVGGKSQYFEEAFAKLENVKEMANELVKLSNESKEFDTTKIQSEEIKNGLHKIRMAPKMFVLGEDYFGSVLFTTMALGVISTTAEIDPYMEGANMPNHSNEALAFDPDILKIIKTSKDAEELKYYWEAWRNQNTIWANQHFANIVEAIQSAAHALDVSALEFWYSSYDNKDFIDEMEKVMEEIKPFYQELHAFIRHELHKKYGSEVVDPHGPIPDHLMQQVFEQVWRPDSVFEEYFPFAELPVYDSLVEKYTAPEMLMEANKFFTSMGFESFDKEFFETNTKANEEFDGSDCRSDISDVTPQVYMRYCKKVDFRKFIQMHEDMAQAYYAKEKANLPFYHFNSYALQYPVGEAVILSATTPKHLTSIGLSKDSTFSEEMLKNRQFRMGVHTFFTIPQYFILNKVMQDVLNGTIAMDSLNKHYWKLMQDYAGVEPPMDRPEKSIDFPSRFYSNVANNRQTKKFVSEILGYQFYGAICKKIEQPLENCDFCDHTEIGNEIKSMMALGSSKPFTEVIAKILPDNPKICAKALLEYYAPMLDWIKTKNKELDAEVGWTDTKKTIH